MNKKKCEKLIIFIEIIECILNEEIKTKSQRALLKNQGWEYMAHLTFSKRVLPNSTVLQR